MSDSALQIAVGRFEGGTIVSPKGDVDLTGSPMLKHELRSAHSKLGAGERLIVDLTNVPYMDSSGLATLVESMQQSRKTGSKLVVAGLSPRVRAIFEIAKLHMVFTIVGTLDEAKTR